MRNFAWLIPVGFFFLNPSFACGIDEPHFQYGAPEMRMAVEGDWSLTITPAGGAAVQVVVHVAQGSAAASLEPPSGGALMRSAYACGTRTLVRSAAACFDSTQMPLAVTYVSGDPSFANVSLSGEFTVHSLVFASGNLALMIGTYQILAGVKADGSLEDASLGPEGTAGTLAVARE